MPSVDPVTTSAGTADRVPTRPYDGTVPAEPARLPRRGIRRQFGTDAAFLISSLPVAFVAALVVVPVFLVGIASSLLVIGIPLLVGAFVLARLFADAERRRIAPVLRRETRPGSYLPTPPDTGRFRRIAFRLRDGQHWWDVGYVVLRVPLAIIGFVVSLVWAVLALAGITTAIYDWLIPWDQTKDLIQVIGLPTSDLRRILLYSVIGILFALTLPWVVRAGALLIAYPALGMLTGLSRGRAELAAMRVGRDSAVSAEAAALRRLERDIHDGPQQRLVRLAMDLGRLQRQLDADPEAARSTLTEAIGQTRDTLDELRALSRGIAPPILADRGLPSALAALAARSTVPVALSVDLDDGVRLAEAVENTAYFVVAEALANVGKHSEATAVDLRLHRAEEGIVVVVADNGRGGAKPAVGHGLAGLTDRLRSVDGELTITSPYGGPTTVQAEIPC